jgi:hypothetical protein
MVYRPGAGRRTLFLERRFMDHTDTHVNKEAHAETPQGASGERAEPSANTRCTRAELERDAKALLNELGMGMRAAEIRGRHRWTRTAYHRRLKVAETLAREDYDPARAMMVFLQHEARFRNLQREARQRAEYLKSRLEAVAACPKEPEVGREAMLHTALTQTVKFIADCEKEILSCAVRLKVMPVWDAKNKKFNTFAECAPADFSDLPEEDAAEDEPGPASAEPLPPRTSESSANPGVPGGKNENAPHEPPSGALDGYNIWPHKV